MSDSGWTATDSAKDWFWQSLFQGAWNFLWRTIGGNAVVTAASAVAFGAVAYVTHAAHQRDILLVCGGALFAGTLIFIPAWIRSHGEIDQRFAVLGAEMNNLKRRMQETSASSENRIRLDRLLAAIQEGK